MEGGRGDTFSRRKKKLESLVLWLVVLVALLVMISATWTPLHLWVMVSYRLVSVIDQDILQIIKHCLDQGQGESYLRVRE